MNSKPILKNIRLLQIEELLSQGADERITINDDGITKYAIPLLDNNIINRGSCTCSPATEEDAELIAKTLENNKSEKEWISQIDSISTRLKAVLNEDGNDELELFFAPSGTDLVYYSLMIASLMNREKNILTITTCIEELGSGTRLAASAKFYSNYNQFGEKISKGESILRDVRVKSHFFNARSENGEILNSQEEILSLIEKNKDCSIIINLVYGSKSGIEDSIGLIDRIAGDNIFWNTDFCQFRHSKTIINRLIKKKSTVMITGSKFYQSPPFCAALIVPKEIYRQIIDVDDWSSVKAFDSIFSSFDLPSELREKANFRNKINIPVILRWQCALEEIEKYARIPEEITKEKIEDWRSVIGKYLEQIESFEMMPHQEKTNKTIISFRVKYQGKYLNETELKKLHNYMVSSEFSYLQKKIKIFLGQPVTYDDNKSFLRLAIGSKNIREFIKNDEKEFELDKSIIDALVENINKYNENN